MSESDPRNPTRPIVWTIAGSDSGGSAGLQGDLRVFYSMGVHGATVVTAVTAQTASAVSKVEFLDEDILGAQLAALDRELRPSAIKTGMLGDPAAISEIRRFLIYRDAPVVCDPVMAASSGSPLSDPQGLDAMKTSLFPVVTLVTPNLTEAEALVGFTLSGPARIEEAALELLETGAKEVIIKGGHAGGEYSQDYWTDGFTRAWLVSPRKKFPRTHGTGCTFSAAVAAARALGMGPLDSCVLAKAFLNRGLRLSYWLPDGCPVLGCPSWPREASFEDLPWLVENGFAPGRRAPFPTVGPRPLGFYPVVDSLDWVRRLLPLGITTIQLRIKDQNGERLEREIQGAVQAAREKDCRLFVNDHWELAMRFGAYGVHLGQDDLRTADLDAIAAAGLRLGVSTHCYSEVARAHAINPSYVAIGPIFPTTAKPMPFAPQGVESLALWKKLLPYPLVAIGGIKLESAKQILTAGAASANGINGIAVISDLTQNPDPEGRARAWVETLAQLK